MRVPEKLSTAFGKEFEDLIGQFALEKELLPEIPALHSTRFLARSVIPHIKKLSSLFNREEIEQNSGLSPYWKESSNPAHLRLAYFLYFMPSNLYRTASVWAELARLGYQWQGSKVLRGIEFGAGPASGACGIAAGEHHAPVGLPRIGNWALIEQNKEMLDLGSSWAETYFTNQAVGDWGIRKFHRKIELSQGFLPRSAPQFNLWLMSFYLNELTEPTRDVAAALFHSWENHLEEGGLAILVEPALRLQSRRLLELRKELLLIFEKKGRDDFQVLLPCLGHQACGALADAEDWCHEEVSWWRPPYFRKIDQMASLDRKTLPFTYLVVARSKRPRNELLPALGVGSAAKTMRLVSPAHNEGKEKEFFLCTQEGKRRARLKPGADTVADGDVNRGDILQGVEIRGDENSSRISKVGKIIR